MKPFTTTRVVSKVVEFLTGTPASDVEDIMIGDPRELERKARKVLKLSPGDVQIIRSIKRITPTTWSLQHLQIPRKVYEDYLKELKKQDDLTEEYQEIRLKTEVQIAQEKLPKIDGFINFQNMLLEKCRPVFAHTEKWRFIPSLIHLKSAKSILDRIVERESLTLLDVFRINIFMYYAVFNAVMGIKIDKKAMAA